MRHWPPGPAARATRLRAPRLPRSLNSSVSADLAYGCRADGGIHSRPELACPGDFSSGLRRRCCNCEQEFLWSWPVDNPESPIPTHSGHSILRGPVTLIPPVELTGFPPFAGMTNGEGGTNFHFPTTPGLAYLSCLHFRGRGFYYGEIQSGAQGGFPRGAEGHRQPDIGGGAGQGVSVLWVQLHRTEDPAFRREVDEAVAAAKAALRSLDKLGTQGRTGEGCRPPSGWGFLDGEELVVKGTGGSGGGKRVQIARARLRQWSPRVEERFLAALGATCNVKAACAEVGLTAASAYGHRKRWRAFAERWDAAVEEGYMRLECGLVEAAGNFLSGEALPDPLPLREMTVAQAIHLLHMHKHQVHALGAPGKRWKPPPSLHDPAIRQSILRKFEMVLAAGAVGEEQRARDRKEWAKRRPAPGQAPSDIPAVHKDD